MRTFAPAGPAPGPDALGLYSDSVRFPAYVLSKSGEVIRPSVVESSRRLGRSISS